MAAISPDLPLPYCRKVKELDGLMQRYEAAVQEIIDNASERQRQSLDEQKNWALRSLESEDRREEAEPPHFAYCDPTGSDGFTCWSP